MKPRHWFVFSATCMACAAQQPPPQPPEPQVVDEGPKWPVVKCVESPVSTPVATFDPNADTVLTGGGGKRPDEYTLSLVFACQDDAVSQCVGAEKEVVLAEAEARAADEERRARKSAKGKKSRSSAKSAGKKGKGQAQPDAASTETADGTNPEGSTRVEPGLLVGEGYAAVLLDPSGQQPLGVNVTVPEPYAQHREFVECLQVAVAGAPYPHYDGPPFVVEFEFELDPGYEVYDEDGGLSSAEAIEAPTF